MACWHSAALASHPRPPRRDRPEQRRQAPARHPGWLRAHQRTRGLRGPLGITRSRRWCRWRHLRTGIRSILLVAPTGRCERHHRRARRPEVHRGPRRARSLPGAPGEILADVGRVWCAGLQRIGFLKAGVAGRMDALASVQTLAARERAPPADVVVWDEAHHRRPDLPRDPRGPTRRGAPGPPATTAAGGPGPLGDCFDNSSWRPPGFQLRDRGFLVPAT